MATSNFSASRQVLNEATQLRALQSVMDEIARTLTRLECANSEHLGNALLNLTLVKLMDQHGRERTAALLARVVEELWSDTLPDTPERALDVLRLDA